MKMTTSSLNMEWHMQLTTAEFVKFPTLVTTKIYTYIVLVAMIINPSVY